jgi:hypothetical protein
MTLHLKLDRRHAAAMGITASDSEQRQLFYRLAKSGKHDEVRALVDASEIAVRSHIGARLDHMFRSQRHDHP